MAQTLKKVNIDGEVFTLAGEGGGGGKTTAAPVKYIFGRAIPLNAEAGKKYFFTDGVVKFRGGDDTGWREVSPSLVGAVFTVPEGFGSNPKIIAIYEAAANSGYVDIDDETYEYLAACVSSCSPEAVTGDTESPYFKIVAGRVIYTRTADTIWQNMKQQLNAYQHPVAYGQPMIIKTNYYKRRGGDGRFKTRCKWHWHTLQFSALDSVEISTAARYLQIIPISYRKVKKKVSEDNTKKIVRYKGYENALMIETNTFRLNEVKYVRQARIR